MQQEGWVPTELHPRGQALTEGARQMLPNGSGANTLGV